MRHPKSSQLAALGLLLGFVGCQAGGPPASIAVPPAAASSAAASMASETAELPEHVIAQWSVPGPVWIFAESGSMWVMSHGGGPLTGIDPISNAIIDPTSGQAPKLTDGAAGFDSRWITRDDNTLERVDPATGQIVASIRLDDGPLDILNLVVVGTTAVWVVQSDKAELIKVDPQTNSIVSRTPWTTLIRDAEARPTVPAGKGTDFLWIEIVGDEGGGVGLPKGLLRLDPVSGAGLTFLRWSPDQDGDGHLTITDAAVWYGAGGYLYRIDVASNRIAATYAIAPGIIHVGVGFGSMWLANYGRSVVQRLDVAP